LTSGILGVLFALAQHDLKRFLAYHSIENIGIIALGIGIGLLGRSLGNPLISLLGFGGALLHVLNHGLFKSLLFFGVGAIAQASGTRELEQLGGLLKQMPRTAFAFLIGCAAISGLPPFNGFVSEWLIYAGSFRGILAFPGREGVVSLAAILGLALIGGLAAACFAKVFGIVFLGSPRTDRARQAHEVGLAMTAPMGLLALACVVVGLWPAGALQLTLPAVAFLLGIGPEGLGQPWQEIGQTLTHIGVVAIILIGIIFFLTLLRRTALAHRQVHESVTWDCGYTFPTARMQYTASSFAQPLLLLFKSLLRTRLEEERPAGYFPSQARIASHTPDVAKEYGFRPIAAGVVRTLDSLRWMQRGRVQWYLLYIVVTLVVLLIWKLGM
jgi:hydrogenase-4 component B